ncbi:MAG TPA: hemolysin family protein [Micromonosporaceae bacterium]|nr:hemolysin family protein [Micromonosporaceae bacterium]
MSTGWALTLSVLLLVLNAFFVAAEFALVASKRYRLEQAAATGSRAARAALAGSRELSLMLAGAQLGITVCTLGLGALAEPAIEHLLSPLLGAAGLGTAASHVVALVFALAVVTFLHLVVGEMAPKSWAISDPERSALLLALPFRAFARVARPALAVLNGMANATLRLVGVRPQEHLAQVHGPDELRMLLEQSRAHGLLPVDQHAMLTKMLELQGTRVADIMEPVDRIVAVRRHDDVERVEAVSRDTGRSRLAVLDAPGAVAGIVHVRDVVRATTEGARVTAGDLMTPPFSLPATATVTEAVAAMRSERAQLALVSAGPGNRAVGFVSLEDLLEEVIGEFDDETDPVPRGRRMR